MFKLLEEIFIEMGYKDLYFRQGSFAEDDIIPSSYFAFWNSNSNLDAHYDNDNHKVIWNWYVYFYTKDFKLLYTELERFITIAKSKGFVFKDEGYDIPSDVPLYVGRMTQAQYIEIKS